MKTEPSNRSASGSTGAIWLVRLSVLVGCWLLAWTLMEVPRVRSHSMEPTLRPGERFLLWKPVYWRRTPRQGELVVFVCPLTGQRLIKRVAAPPAGRTVPDAHVWVEGDNAARSVDSRHFGPIPLGSILGRAIPLRGR
jgi:signal peptidase I